MITPEELLQLGFSSNCIASPIFQKALHLAQKMNIPEEVYKASLRQLLQKPDDFLHDTLFRDVAILLTTERNTLPYIRETPAPYQQWGGADMDDMALAQMQNACSLPIAIRGALMPDAHVGYGLPIGGVLAVEKAVIPYAVGVDIACRMRLTVTDIPMDFFNNKHERIRLIEALEKKTRFGVGASFAPHERHEHPIMDEDWGESPITKEYKDLAWKQLGTSGGGNHFAEFGELYCDADVELGGILIKKGSYLSLLSHSGSRGTGEKVADYYCRRAMQQHPWLPKPIQHLAWFDMESHDGQEYWNAMERMGRYAEANHALIHHHILQYLGAKSLTSVENHHNFAWHEEVDGKPAIVHRKGATPAASGVQGIIPGSMGTPGFVVSGKGDSASLNSCSHGAGRIMSRGMALRQFTEDDVSRFLTAKGIELLSGGSDEAPMVYKDIFAIMQAQEDLVHTLARFDPKIVKMAPAKNRRASGSRKRKGKKKK